MSFKLPVNLLTASLRRFNHVEASATRPKVFQAVQSQSKFRFNFAMPSDTNQILNFVQKNYFCHDSLSRSLNLCEKKLDTTMELYIKDSLSQGMSIVARKASQEEEIVGVSINQKSCKWDGDRLDELAQAAESINTRKLLHIWALLAREPALHDYVSQLSIFDLKFVSVNKELNGMDLAFELTKQSLALGRDLNFKFARIDSTDEETKVIAEKFQMEKVWDVPYKNVVSDDGKTPVAVPEHPNTHATTFLGNLGSLTGLDSLKNLGMNYAANVEPSTS